MPGLFQTEAYATALAMADVRRGTITRRQAEERVTFLLARQQLLRRGSPPLVHAVLDESCLRRPIGGSAVMEQQFSTLEEQFDASHVILQVARSLWRSTGRLRCPCVS
ncbi:DUF5753 domain-containing protein [Kitasatospora sp. NBC_01560]